MQTSVAASVGGSVAGVVSGSASAAAAGTGGGSASASSSSSGGAGALFLINQVQFLSLVGRFGKGDESAMTGFSDSFRWANLDFQVTRAWVPPQEGDARRNEKHGSSSKAVPKKIISGRTNSTHGSAECAVYGDCSLYCHRDIVEGIVTLMATLLLVYVSRVAVRALVERVKPDTDLSALAFPVWEVFNIVFNSIHFLRYHLPCPAALASAPAAAPRSLLLPQAFCTVKTLVLVCYLHCDLRWDFVVGERRGG